MCARTLKTGETEAVYKTYSLTCQDSTGKKIFKKALTIATPRATMGHAEKNPKTGGGKMEKMTDSVKCPKCGGDEDIAIVDFAEYVGVEDVHLYCRECGTSFWREV